MDQVHQLVPLVPIGEFLPAYLDGPLEDSVQEVSISESVGRATDQLSS
jgi:hypothetical protein